MTSELIRQRADLIDTQVIASDTGKRLGIVKELLVDIDTKEVVALGLRDSWIPAPGGLIRYMFLNTIEKMGDVILVPNDDVIEDVDPEAYTNLINCEVITDSGDLLGKVRGYKFSCDDGRLTAIILAAVGLPFIPERAISTYELSIDEVVASGPNRLIVQAGAEEKLEQLSVGFLERIGLGKAPWEDDYSYGRPNVVRPENQLPAGTPVAPPPPAVRRPQPIQTPIQQPAWEEEELEEVVVPAKRTAPPQRMAQQRYEDEIEPRNAPPQKSRSVPARELDEEEEYQDVAFTPVTVKLAAPEPEAVSGDDMWGEDTKSDNYQPQKVELPDRSATVQQPIEKLEYHEEDR
jgi:sporulation protein YlmC with PRC-barrel domain